MIAQLDMMDRYPTTKEPQMPIKFIVEDENLEPELTFDMVKDDQFFVAISGQLCQKNGDGAFGITDNNGKPYCWHINVPNINMKIKKILPKIKKIEF